MVPLVTGGSKTKGPPMKRTILRIAIVCAAVGASFAVVAVRAADGEKTLPAARPAVIEAIKNLLDEGFASGPKHLPVAQKKYQVARKVAGEDPRLDYAYGLVLLKQAQHKQALVQFEAAIGRPGPAYWPAWQALIWGRLVERQHEKGL